MLCLPITYNTTHLGRPMSPSFKISGQAEIRKGHITIMLYDSCITDDSLTTRLFPHRTNDLA